MKIIVALLVGSLAAPGLARAADRPGEWQCHLLPMAARGKERLAVVDPARGRVQEGATLLADGMASPMLPDLVYFVRVTPGEVVWGARNARTASIYYRYDMQEATGRLTYQADGVNAAAGRCDNLNI